MHTRGVTRRTFTYDQICLLDIRQPKIRIGSSTRLDLLRPKLREQISEILWRRNCRIGRLVNKYIAFVCVCHSVKIELRVAGRNFSNRKCQVWEKGDAQC